MKRYRVAVATLAALTVLAGGATTAQASSAPSPTPASLCVTRVVYLIRVTHDPYGNSVSTSGSLTSPFGFSGQYTDSESGLIYLRARYYDPLKSQFLTVDPAVSQTHSPHACVAADPLNATDPSGLHPVWGARPDMLPPLTPTWADALTAASLIPLPETAGLRIAEGIADATRVIALGRDFWTASRRAERAAQLGYRAGGGVGSGGSKTFTNAKSWISKDLDSHSGSIQAVQF